MFQIENSKAASIMMAAFFVAGCQPKEDKYFEVSGGDPILFQHFFWFIGHPEIFLPLLLITIALVILLLRRISKRFAAFTNKPFSLKFTMPRLWLYGWIIFILLNVSAAYIWPILISGSSFGAQSYLHDTYYVVAHFHYILSLSLVFFLFSGLYWGLGRYLKYAYNQTLAIIQFVLFVIGVSLILLPQFTLLTGGMPRRYVDPPQNFEIWNVIATFGAVCCLISAAAFILVVIEALVKKRPIGDRDAEKNGKRNEP